jgi:hypothetical protein
MTDDNKEIPMPAKVEETPVVEPVNLTIADINICKTIIETASKRGTFKADELQLVGLTYSRISQWLKENKLPEENEPGETSSDNQGEEKND